MKTTGRVGIVLILILSTIFLLGGIALALPLDIQGHWAEKEINDWQNNGFIKGYQNGSFKPDNGITRAEFIALVNRSFKLTASVRVDFSDVVTSDWFAGEVAKAQAAGYITGYQDGTFGPGKLISRQEAALILSRLLMLDTELKSARTINFKDADLISAWSSGAVEAVVADGYMNGYPDQTYRPEKSITRAEAIITLDRALTTVLKTAAAYTKAGTYGPATGMESVESSVTVSAAGITLRNMKISGNLVLAEGIGEGDVTLNNVTVLGQTDIRGGGTHSVVLENCTMPSVTVCKEGVRVVAYGNTSVSAVLLESGAVLVKASVDGSGFETVTVSEVIPANAKVTLSGNFNIVKVNAKGVKVEISGGTVIKLEAGENATGVTIDIADNAKIGTLIRNTAVTLTGKGKVEVTQVTSGGRSSGNGGDSGSGDGNNPLSFLGAYLTTISGNSSTTGNSVEDNAAVTARPTMKLTFDRGVVRDYWDNNKQCVSIESSSGTNVPVNVSRIADVEEEKRNIFVAPSSSLNSGETYNIIIKPELKANNGGMLGEEKIIAFKVVSSGGGGGGGGSSTPSAPIFLNAITTADGMGIIVTFDKAMAGPSGMYNGFSVLSDGIAIAVTAAALNTDSTKINLYLAAPVSSCGSNVTLQYSGSGVTAADGGVLAVFTAKPVTNNLQGAAPVLLSAEVTTKGDVSLIFNKEIAVPAPESPLMVQVCAQFTVATGGVTKMIEKLETTNTSGKIKLVLADTDKLVSGQAVTVTYTKGTDQEIQIKAKDGGVLQSFTFPGSAPVMSNADVTDQGEISMTFSKDMVVPAFDSPLMAQICGQFTVKVNGVDDVVSVVQSAYSLEKICLVLSDKILAGQSVTLAYTKSTEEAQIKAKDGGLLESFTELVVTNNLLLSPPEPDAAEVTNKGDISITFNKDMSDPTGKHSRFTVKVDSNDVVVTKAELTSEANKVKLVLVSKVTHGQTVTVAYTKDSDVANQIKAADGGVLETFDAINVSNNL